MDFLSTASSALQVANGVKSLFGGGDGASANDLSASQLHYNLLGMQHAPHATVVGLRRAGLNPMLAIGKATPQASVGMSSPVDDRQVSTARGLAAASIANQAAQADLYSAQAANVRAQTLTEAKRPGQIAQDTATSLAMEAVHRATSHLTSEKTATQRWSTLKELTNFHMDKLQYEEAFKNLPTRVKAEADSAVAAARSATTKAELDERLSELERIVAMGSEAVGAITGGIGRVVSSAVGAKRLSQPTRRR